MSQSPINPLDLGPLETEEGETLYEYVGVPDINNRKTTVIQDDGEDDDA